MDNLIRDEGDKICSNFYINHGCYLNGDITLCIYGGNNSLIIGNIFKDNLTELFKTIYKYHDFEYCKICPLYVELEDYEKDNIINILNVSYDYRNYINTNNWRIGNNDNIK